MARQSAPAETVPVLLTRPVAEAKAFAAALTERLGDRVLPVIAPLMVVRHLAPALPPGPFAAVIFTSSAAIDAARPLAAVLPNEAWCVGQKTAARATAAGFRARSADGDAKALVAAIRADPPAGRLIHLCGADTRGAVAERLVSAGIETVSLTIYRQEAQPLTPEASALLAAPGPILVPLFSPRSAALFAAALPPDARARLHLVAMSPAVAGAARTLAPHALVVARHPTALSMLEACKAALDVVSPP